MITNKQFTWLLFFLIISGIIAIILLIFYSIPNEHIEWRYINQSEYLTTVTPISANIVTRDSQRPADSTTNSTRFVVDSKKSCNLLNGLLLL